MEVIASSETLKSVYKTMVTTHKTIVHARPLTKSVKGIWEGKMCKLLSYYFHKLAKNETGHKDKWTY
jgi:hypothetical protein